MNMVARRIPRLFARLSLAVLLLLTAAASLTFGQDRAEGAPLGGITLTGPSNVTIAESDDYATQVLGDPWEMNNRDDLDYMYRFDVPDVSNGIWSANTTAGDAHVLLQYQGFDSVYSYVGEKDGSNYPIATGRYRRLFARIYTERGGPTRLYWFERHNRVPAGASDIFTLQPGWHIYNFDLAVPYPGQPNNWLQLGTVAGVRFDAPWNETNNNIKFDWVRLTPDAHSIVDITWTYEGGGNTALLYLSTSPNPGESDEMLIAEVPAGNQIYRWSHTGIAPGTYYIHAKLNGAATTTTSTGPLHVNTAPLLRIDAPSPVSGEDYAHTVLGTTWEGYNPGQFRRTENVTPPIYTPEFVQTSATTNDPQLWWLDRDDAHPIDTAKYRYMSIRMYLQAPAGNPTAQFNAGPRMTWARSNPLEWQQTYHTAVEYYRWVPMVYDLATAPLEPGSNYGWTGLQTTLRFDPHEEDGGSPGAWSLPEYMRISHAHLTGNPVSGAGTIIRWDRLQGGGTVNIYYDTDNSGYNGTLIAANVPLSQGAYIWNTAGVPQGSYWIYTSANDAYNGDSSRFYSLVPLVVNHSSPSTLFTDIPTNYWAVADVNDLALRGILSGYTEEDGSAYFRPGNTATRGQLSKMVVLAAGWPLPNPSNHTFADVPSNSTFFQYVEAAADRDVISGYACGGPGEPCDGQNRPYFRPNNNVTRGQTSKMVVLSRGWALLQPPSPTFADVPPNSTFYEYVETAADHDIISGYACGGPGEPCDGQNRPYFRPGNAVTRAQLSKMISRSLVPADK